MTKKQQEQLEAMRHSAAHLMAAAVLEIFPDAKFGMGPTIEDGFYYDFDLDRSLTPEDLPKIEKIMKRYINQDIPFEKMEMDIEEALKFFKEKKQLYKVELIKDLKKEGGKKVSLYKCGDFVDLCRGPHIKSAKEIGAFKLLKIAGAYWKGDEGNKMLQRIYGTAWFTKKELENYLKRMEEAEKRDHRKLGQELDLFMLDDDVGQGLPLWLPKGAVLRQQMEDFVLNEYVKRGYKLVKTPHIGSEKLFNISGHLEFYGDSMYSPIEVENELYYLKPMNCPMHVKIYNRDLHSYRDLPVRYTEFGTVYRYERSGTLHGLTRVRGFTQDDAHIICVPEQLEDEVIGVLELTDFIFKTFGFKEFKVALSVRDLQDKSKYLGSDKEWEKAENSLINALDKIGWPYIKEEGEAVFYGPKIDIKVTDAIGREWQISTIQFDFNLPEKFDMNYVDEKGKKKKPFMIHRALLGSLERFTGVLIEHYAGSFPVWLSPVQVQIINVNESHAEFCKELAEELKIHGIRVDLNLANETVGNKIRKAEKQKVPYMLVIGDKEIKSKNLHVRIRGEKNVVEMPKKKFVDKIRKEVKDYK